MQLVAYNQPQLDTIIRDICRQFDTYQSLAITYDKPARDKTRDQLGFFFGALVKNIQSFFKDRGNTYTPDEIKENFYSAAAYLNENMSKTVRRFNGKTCRVPKRLSEMTLAEANLFIDLCLNLVDQSPVFDGLVLHPSIRYTWVRKIDSDQIRHLPPDRSLPRHDPAFLEHTRKQACLWCGKANQSEAHHLRLAGLSGTGIKSPDWCTVPLCHDCHIGQLHQSGANRLLRDLDWITRYLDLTDFCKINYLKWLNKGEKTC